MKKKSLFIATMLLLMSSMLFSNPIREAYTINSHWKFKKGDVTLKSPLFTDFSWQLVNIPHTWNVDDVMDDVKGYYRGATWYYKTISVENNLKGKKIFIHFEGANQEAEVYVNGSLVGKHKGGYTAFTFDITNQLIFNDKDLTSDNEIAVKLDNSNNPDIAPLSADFTFYGGIYRDVWIVATNDVHFDMLNAGSKGVFIQTPSVTADKATVRLFGKVVNNSNVEKNLTVVTTIVDENLTPFKKINSAIKVKAKQTFNFDVSDKTVSGYKLWSIEEPNMYKAISQIIDTKTGEVIDEIINPIAFRWYKFDPNKGFFLNDKPVKLVGANRHQDYKGIGNALPDYMHRRDIKLLKEMGANFIRISHYPQDMALVDACDELGLVASIEIPNVNNINESEEYHNNSKTMMTEMVRQYYNHPSIMIWCLMNEIRLREPNWTNENPKSLDKDKYAEQIRLYNLNLNKLATDLNTIAKTEDPYRYTMICHHGDFAAYQAAGLNTITDIVGWNLYFGWYRTNLFDLDTFMDDFRKQVPNKSIIITEYGVGVDTRIRTNTPKRFDNSVEYSDVYHDYYLNYMLKHDFISGGAIWNFADFNSEGRKDQMPNINNKGMVTWDRKPKDVYYLYQAYLLNTPVIKIAPAQYEQRAGLQDEEGKIYSTQKVWVYTNLPKVELVVNGKSMGKVDVVNKKATFDVPFVNGENRIEAIAALEGKLYKDYQSINFILHPINFKSNEVPFKELFVNAGAHFDFYDDYTRSWLPEKDYNEKNYGFIGGKTFLRWMGSVPGTDKVIYGSNNEPLYQTQRVNPEAFTANVPKGIYEVEMHFCELLTSSEIQATVYNLGAEANEGKLSQRVFSVAVNGDTCIQSLNLAKEFGEQWAYSKKIIVKVEDDNGINIKFIPIEGEPVINGISIHRKQ